MAESFFDRYRLAWRHLRRAAWQLIIFDFWFGLIYSFVLNTIACISVFG